MCSISYRLAMSMSGLPHVFLQLFQHGRQLIDCRLLAPEASPPPTGITAEISFIRCTVALQPAAIQSPPAGTILPLFHPCPYQGQMKETELEGALNGAAQAAAPGTIRVLEMGPAPAKGGNGTHEIWRRDRSSPIGLLQAPAEDPSSFEFTADICALASSATLSS